MCWCYVMGDNDDEYKVSFEGITWWPTHSEVFMHGRDAFYIGKEQARGTYKFAAFQDIEEYVGYFVHNWQRNKRVKSKVPLVFSELIAEWKPRRLYFDIEYIKNDKYPFNPDQFIDAMCTCIIAEMAVLKCEITAEDIFLLCSSGEKSDGTYKYSYHLVISSVYVSDSYQSSKFAANVIDRMKMTDIDREFLSAIDTGVYTKNHLMRMAGCVKYSKDEQYVRVMRLEEFVHDGVLRTYSGHEPGQEPRGYDVFADWEYILYNTIIQNVTGTEVSYPNLLIPMFEYADDMTQEQVDAVLNIVVEAIDVTTWYTNEGDDAFEVDKCTPSMIHFKRIGPSFCSMCKRVHGDGSDGNGDNMSAFINKSGDVYMRCWRNNKKDNIGNYKTKKAIKKQNIFVAKMQDAVNVKRMGITGDSMVKFLLQTNGLIPYGKKYNPSKG